MSNYEEYYSDQKHKAEKERRYEEMSKEAKLFVQKLLEEKRTGGSK